MIGRLAELVKKIHELEQIISEHANAELAAELSAYNLVLANWPVENAAKTKELISLLKMQLSRLQITETRFRQHVEAKNEQYILIASAQYVELLSEVRHTMKMVNRMGRFIGDTIWLELLP